MRSKTMLALAGVTLMVMALIPTAASAATMDGVSDATQNRACTVGTLPQRGEPDPHAPVVVSCFDTLEQAEAFVEAGAPGDYEKLVPQARTSRAAATTVIIGRQYTGDNRTGSVLVQWGSGSGCYGVTYGFSSMPSGWNDVIRSSEGFNNCWVTDYADAGYGGARANCTPYCGTLASLASQTSSVVYRPWGSVG
ncbi:hypothetical protein [Microbacterium sp. SORGH_AS_0888]|uniref:hypothetical protein n=1 Tax=Microbacterium sp. SORGH_AS_0888 TaxID=3041791 RepID=UPI002785FEDD|nr:hypothetical protein [Microbacterium sp. SORGH_AS_0888]MDQ1129426.1 hypothetical protein [Microbacterium sp. SORGH_AS_0888]